MLKPGWVLATLPLVAFSMTLGAQSPKDWTGLRRFFRQLREACRIDKRLQRREQPVIPGRTIIASQLSLPDSRIGRN